MMSAAKAARVKASKLKLCDSLAAYLGELAPTEAEAGAEEGGNQSIDHQGMQVMGKAHGGDSAETDPWATLGGGKKGKKGKKKKGGKAKASGLQHSMIRLNGFAEVRCGKKGCPVHVPRVRVPDGPPISPVLMQPSSASDTCAPTALPQIGIDPPKTADEIASCLTALNARAESIAAGEAEPEPAPAAAPDPKPKASAGLRGLQDLLHSGPSLPGGKDDDDDEAADMDDFLNGIEEGGDD